MSVNISPETQDKISALCKKISVAHNLDEEIQKELRCHIEDRLTGYLSGNEQLSEDDAFILVEKHFGDPAKVKALYQNVEAMATHASFIRRVGAVISASLGAGILYYFMVILYQLLRPLLFVTRINDFINLNDFIYIFTLITCAFVLWYVIINWRKKLDNGQYPWFLIIKPNKFFLLLLCLSIGHISSRALTYLTINYNDATLVKAFEEMQFFDLLPSIVSNYYDAFGIRTAFPGINLEWAGLLFGLFLLSQCIAWLWWCDSSPRRVFFLVIAALIWFGFINIIYNLPPVLILYFEKSSMLVTTRIRFPASFDEIRMIMFFPKIFSIVVVIGSMILYSLMRMSLFMKARITSLLIKD